MFPFSWNPRPWAFPAAPTMDPGTHCWIQWHARAVLALVAFSVGAILTFISKFNKLSRLSLKLKLICCSNRTTRWANSTWCSKPYQISQRAGWRRSAKANYEGQLGQRSTTSKCRTREPADCPEYSGQQVRSHGSSLGRSRIADQSGFLHPSQIGPSEYGQVCLGHPYAWSFTFQPKPPFGGPCFTALVWKRPKESYWRA